MPPLSSFAVLLCTICCLLAASAPAIAAGSPKDLERKIAPSVCQLNVAINVKLKDQQYAQLAGLSPRFRYPVFATTADDKGFRVVGSGSCFVVKTVKNDQTYFLTNRHVVDFGAGMLEECQRFFAAMRLHAERTAAFGDVGTRYKQLMHVINLALKKDMSSEERQLFNVTADSIWDTYDNHLSLKADPSRAQFKKYLILTGYEGASGYFIHQPGPAKQATITARLLKTATSNQPDLAVLNTSKTSLQPLPLGTQPPKVGETVQALGYPVDSIPGRSPNAKEYKPAGSTGKVSFIGPGFIEFDARVSKGDSGGPLVDQSGKVIGIVSKRAKPLAGMEEKYATAIDAASIKKFAPDLFGK